MEFITNHPILKIPNKSKIRFTYNNKELIGFEGMVISSALFLNNIKIFGHHKKDGSPQGIFCANGQCSQCNVIVNGVPVKACMTVLKENMIVKSCNGLPELPANDEPVIIRDSKIINVNVLVIGAGPAGLSATKVLGENDINVILIDDKERCGGKLVLQTHKFFGSQKEVYAGKRGIEIAEILGNSVLELKTVEGWMNSPAIAVFRDGLVGVLKNGVEYILVKPEHLLVATGAREKMLIFPGNTLPGVYGAGAFQTLVNRDLIKPAQNIFIVGGGNVGLIAGYHAIQAGINVVGLIEALPQCGGYNVHEDKLQRLGIPIYTSHGIISANGENKVKSITIGKLDKDGAILLGSEKTFQCDTILIAVGLNPVDEFYLKAKEFGMNAWVAGDAQEIAEASTAIFTGKIEALRILSELGIEHDENIQELQNFVKLFKMKPPPVVDSKKVMLEEGIFPLFHCNQEIPCNPCTSVCPQKQILTIDNLLTQLPLFKNEEECIGCGKCVAVCPGLAITLLDYRKDREFPFVTFPLELSTERIEKGQKVFIVSNKRELGKYTVVRSVILKEFPKTQLITVKVPASVAKSATAIKLNEIKCIEPVDYKQEIITSDDIIICRCERVTIGEIRKWIRNGVRDINELKALTQIGMGSCGGKTCYPLINRIYREEGIPEEKVNQGTNRPLFIEVPMGIFANARNGKEEDS